MKQITNEEMLDWVKIVGNFALIYSSAINKWTVVIYSMENGKVISAMPADHPSSENGTARWIANSTDAGVNYVAGWYSESYARKKFREFTKYMESRK